MGKIFGFVFFFLNFIVFASSSLAYSGKVGTYFFWWFSCPAVVGSGLSLGCDPSLMPYRGVGVRVPYPEGGYYNLANKNWYKREFRDMVSAGITDVFPVSYQGNGIGPMVQALREENYPLKFGFYWGPQGWVEGGVWDFENPEHRETLYLGSIKPFFQAIPRNFWSTEGGRPIIFITYRELSKERNVGWGTEMLFKHFKDRFSQDFGVVPFLIVHYGWFEYPLVEERADAKFTWVGGQMSFKTDIFKDYIITNLTPGSKVFLPGYPPSANLDREGGDLFKRNLAQVPETADLLMITTWNELFEGTSIERMVDYYDQSDRPMKDIFYMQILQEYLRKPAIPALTNLPPTPTNLSATCNSQNCSFSWSLPTNIYADNVRYMYKILGSTVNGSEKLCPPYTFDNTDNTYHGTGCWRGNTSDTIPRQGIVCPGGACTLYVWARDGSGNVSAAAIKAFNVSSVSFLDKGWNWVMVNTNQTIDDLKNRNCILESRDNGWWKWAVSAGKKLTVKCPVAASF